MRLSYRRVLPLLLLLAGCRRAGSSPAAPNDQPLTMAAGPAVCANVVDCQARCAAGTSAACLEAGRLYEFGHAGLASPERAFPFYQRSCGLQDAAGCFNMAFLLESGRGVRKDTRRAADLYHRVCLMGSSTGCNKAETLSALLKP